LRRAYSYHDRARAVAHFDSLDSARPYKDRLDDTAHNCKVTSGTSIGKWATARWRASIEDMTGEPIANFAPGVARPRTREAGG
jgi:hypothetical protein